MTEPGFGSGNGNNYNVTTEPTHIDISTEPEWILSVVGSVIIILTNLYIAVAFIYHVVSTKILKKKRSKRDVNGGLVMILAMVAIVAPFFRYLGTLFILFVGLNPKYLNGCEIANDICVVGFGLAILPNYAFLWARQRAFYNHPSLGHMFGTCVGIFSKMSLFLIVATAISLIGLGVYPVEYTHGRGGCVLIGEEEQYEYRTYVYAFVMISSQLFLLGLFLHPIRLHAQSQKGMHPSEAAMSKSEVERSSDFSESSDPSMSAKSLAHSTTEDRHPSVQVNNNETSFTNATKQYRSQSLPNDNNILTIPLNANGVSDSDSELCQVHRSRPSTVQFDINATKKTQRNKSLVPKAVSNLKRKMRRTTMRTKRVYALIRRILYLALFSIASDLVSMVINGFLIPDDIPQTYSFVLYDFNLLINIATIVLSFENWRKIMMSPFKRKQAQKSKKASSSGAEP